LKTVLLQLQLELWCLPGRGHDISPLASPFSSDALPFASAATSEALPLACLVSSSPLPCALPVSTPTTEAALSLSLAVHNRGHRLEDVGSTAGGKIQAPKTDYIPPLSMPATATSLTARSTLFRPALTVSVADFRQTMAVEKRRAGGRASVAVRRTGVVL